MVKDDAMQDTRLLGTRGYAPPEQYGFSQTGARTDVYSLGATLEELLFYAENRDYIIQDTADSVLMEESVSMRVDMTGKGNYVDFVIPESLNNWVEFGLNYDLGFHLGELADGIQAAFWHGGEASAIWPTEMAFKLDAIPKNPLVLSEKAMYNQITCADADGDEVKELFVSKGNREDAPLTLVWKLADIKDKSFEYAGYMWGTDTMYLYKNGDIRSLVGETGLNHYDYSDGTLSVISSVDFEEFKAAQDSEPGKDAAEAEEPARTEEEAGAEGEDQTTEDPEQPAVVEDGEHDELYKLIHGEWN